MKTGLELCGKNKESCGRQGADTERKARIHREALPLELGKVSEGAPGGEKVSELRLEGGKGAFQVTGETEQWCRGGGGGLGIAQAAAHLLSCVQLCDPA